MHRFLLLVWLILSCAMMPAQAAQVRSYDDIVESGVLKVAVYDNFPPYSYRADGKPRGVDVDLAAKLAEGLGLKLELLWVTPAKRSMTTCATSSGRGITCVATCWPT